MNPIMMTNAQFYFALSVPLVGILVNVSVMTLLFNSLSRRIDRLEDRYHHLEDRLQTGQDLLVGKIGEIDVRLAKLEERLAK
jgi:hypothetical protein